MQLEAGDCFVLRLFFLPLVGHLRLAAEHFSFHRSTRIWSRDLSLFSTNQTVAFLSLAFSLPKYFFPLLLLSSLSESGVGEGLVVLGGRVFVGFLEVVEVPEDPGSEVEELLKASVEVGPEVEEVGLVFGRFVRIVDVFSVTSSGLVVVLTVVSVAVVLVVVEPVGHFLPLEVNWPLEGRPEVGREGR